MHMKRWFTLIEMLIVIVIASILMAITMKMGGDFVQDIKSKKSREEFLSDFALVRGQLLLSRFNNGVSTASVTVWFDDGDVTTSFVGENDEEDNSPKAITTLYDDITISWPTITIEPYTLACKVWGAKSEVQDDNTDTIVITFLYSKKTYCHTIETSTCKIISTTCPKQPS